MNFKFSVATFLFLMSFYPVAASAQQGAPALTQVQIGQAVFKQRCGVCHIPLIVGKDKDQTLVLSTSTYGPTLTKQIVAPAEDAMREQIKHGSARMPGFQYALKPEQIDAIIAYLKTVDKSAQRGASGATNDLD